MQKSLKSLYQVPSSLKPDDYHHQPNVVRAAAKVLRKFMEYEDVLCCAEMQSGKTEVVRRLIYLIQKYNQDIRKLQVDIDRFNIHLILCASSTNLKSQLRKKLPEIRHQIYHLNDINRIIKDRYENESLLTMMSDASLIVFDECHADAETGKIIDKFRTMIDSIARKNRTSYHRLYISATPYEMVMARYPKVVLDPGPNYYGLVQIFQSSIPLIFQAKDLSDPEECRDLFREIVVCNYYYLFRLPNRKISTDKMMENIEAQFRKHKTKINSYLYDMGTKININEILDSPPTKPTVIYLKDKLRMGEHLNTEYVYLVHDDPNNTYAHTTAQSLLGRCCGYYKKSHQTIIYCDYEKAYQHYLWIKNKYHIDYLPSAAKYIKKDGSGTKNSCIY